MEWKKDAFGNDLHVGDRVVAAVTIVQSPGLRMGTIVKESTTCKEMNWKDYDSYDENHLLEVQKYKIHWDNFAVHDYWPHRDGMKDTVIKGTNLVKI